MIRPVKILVVCLAFFMAGAPVWADSSIAEAKETVRVEDLIRSSLKVWKGGEIIMTRFDLPEGHSSQKHSHPGEGFLYVVEGSMTMSYDSGKEVQAKAGDVVAIPMGEVHQARPGSQGVRGVVFRVHPLGEPERTLVD